MLEIKVTAVAPAQADGLSAAEQVDMALGALGFRRVGTDTAGLGAPAASIPSADKTVDGEDAQVDEARAPAEAPRRRGRPRKEDAAVSAAPVAEEAAQPPNEASPMPTEEQPQIRTSPEDRAEQGSAKKLTHEDLRDALGRMSKALGLKTAVAEVRVLLGGGIQDVPDTQEDIGGALAKIEARIAAGPGTDAPTEPAKTHDDVKAAIVAYAKRFGQEAAKADWKAITGHQKVDEMPSDAAVLGEAVAGILDAVEGNPFGRARVDA